MATIQLAMARSSAIEAFSEVFKRSAEAANAGGAGVALNRGEKLASLLGDRMNGCGGIVIADRLAVHERDQFTKPASRAGGSDQGVINSVRICVIGRSCRCHPTTTTTPGRG